MIDIYYLIDTLRRNWNNVHWWNTIFNREVAGRYYTLFTGNDGIHVMEEDWDNLLILDACRYDLFNEVIDDRDFGIPGELERKTSMGSGTPEFLKENFRGERFYDTVYVTSNPFSKKILQDPFHYTDHVWIEGWDESEQTVLPETVCDRTLAAQEAYPNKRLIGHFMQPHHPFIGRTRLEHDPGLEWVRARATDGDVPDVQFVWERLARGLVSSAEVWRAYRDNLIRVLEPLAGLVDDLEGKTVITSDHGNGFGERAKPFPTRVYGHDERIRIPPLVDVPWYVVEHEERKRTTHEAPSRNVSDVESGEEIEQKLEHLGYV
jgi:hypothetical protein